MKASRTAGTSRLVNNGGWRLCRGHRIEGNAWPAGMADQAPTWPSRYLAAVTHVTGPKGSFALYTFLDRMAREYFPVTN